MGKKQNLEEFTQLIQKNEGIIYKITRAYEANPEYQKDLYQEVVYQLWKAYPAFRKEAKVSTWIYRVALNTSLTYRKARPETKKICPIRFSIPRYCGRSRQFQRRTDPATLPKYPTVETRR